MEIEKVSNGYIAKDVIDKEVFLTIKELFEHLLLIYEGKSDSFSGDSYGKIIIKYDKK